MTPTLFSGSGGNWLTTVKGAAVMSSLLADTVAFKLLYSV